MLRILSRNIVETFQIFLKLSAQFLTRQRRYATIRIMASIYEVAKEAGVSTSTVSRMFRAPESLSRETRERVEEVIARSGYRPRRWKSIAPADEDSDELPSDPIHTIGFQFFSESPDDRLQANEFYAHVLAGAQQEADALGLYLLVNTTHRHQLLTQMPRMIRESEVAGLLLVGTTDPEILSAFASQVSHLILVDNRDDQRNHDCILSDGCGGAASATRYLLSLGHQRIGFVLGDPHIATFQDRFRGYLGAMFDAGFPASDARYVISPSSYATAADALRKLLALPDRPTALLAANDNYALVVLEVCRNLGLSVPRDLSLVGFDDLAFLNHVAPLLTTVHVDKEQMGRQAVRLLHARLQPHANPADPSLQVTLPARLIRRESCAHLEPH